MHTVTFAWPESEWEEPPRQFETIEEAWQFGYETLARRGPKVICTIRRPDLPTIQLCWQRNIIVCNTGNGLYGLPGHVPMESVRLEAPAYVTKPSLAQKTDWRKEGF